MNAIGRAKLYSAGITDYIARTPATAGRTRRKRSNADVWLACAVLLSIAAVVAVLA